MEDRRPQLQAGGGNPADLAYGRTKGGIKRVLRRPGNGPAGRDSLAGDLGRLGHSARTIIPQTRF